MRLSDVSTFMLPDQTNRLALMFDPLSQIPFPFVFGVEIFEPGHRTNPHVHSSAYELFFILSGEGEGFCNNERFPVRPGDIIVFHPGSTHGIDNGKEERMYCVEIMLPDQNFAEFVRAGQLKDLHLDDLCILARIGCA
jgi:gentisate 1,2-dioxygenase